MHNSLLNKNISGMINVNYKSYYLAYSFFKTTFFANSWY